MAELKIVYYPDEPLTRKAAPVEEFGPELLRQLETVNIGVAKPVGPLCRNVCFSARGIDNQVYFIKFSIYRIAQVFRFLPAPLGVEARNK